MKKDIESEKNRANENATEVFADTMIRKLARGRMRYGSLDRYTTEIDGRKYDTAYLSCLIEQDQKRREDEYRKETEMEAKGHYVVDTMERKLERGHKRYGSRDMTFIYVGYGRYDANYLRNLIENDEKRREEEERARHTEECNEMSEIDGLDISDSKEKCNYDNSACSSKKTIISDIISILNDFWNRIRDKLKDKIPLAWRTLKDKMIIPIYTPIVFSRRDIIDAFFMSQSRHRYWERHLTEEQDYAINAYTGNKFKSLNAALRSIYDRGLTVYSYGTGLTGDQRRIIKGMDEALVNYKLENPLRVYRGISPDVMDNFIKDHNPGDFFYDGGYLSASCYSGTKIVNVDVKTEKCKDMIIIDVPEGKGYGAYINFHSQHPDQYEFVFSRKVRLKITVDNQRQKILQGCCCTVINSNVYFFFLPFFLFFFLT